jgi:hypothetical protein
VEQVNGLLEIRAWTVLQHVAWEGPGLIVAGTGPTVDIVQQHAEASCCASLTVAFLESTLPPVTYIPRHGTNELLDQSMPGAEIEDKAGELTGKHS